MSATEIIDPRFDANPTLPGLADPYPIFRAVREADPVHWCSGAKIWAVTGYHDAQSVLKDQRLSRQAYLDALEARNGVQPITQMQRHELVFTDDPVHGRLKHVINEAINAHTVHDLSARIDALIDEKLSPLLNRGEMNVIGDFLLTLPTGVAAAWLGVPDSDRPMITEWIFPLVSGRGVKRDQATMEAANRAAVSFRAYFDRSVAERRKAPAGDLLTHLLRAQAEEPGLLTDDIMFGLFVAIFAGGHTPGIALIALTVLALLQFPQELEKLRANPQLLTSCVEEGLRFVSPTQAPNPLGALEDIELHGKTIRKGEAVTVILAAANRDPEVFADPERFDISRTPNRHLAFSMGEHYCLGALLSRETAQCALGTLAMRLDELKLACDPAELNWIPHDRFRVLERLPVRFRAG